MSQAPAMPMFWDAYLADTTHLSTEEHGAYLLLLGAMWRRGGRVPDDDRDNARITGLSVAKWRRMKARLGPLLTFSDDEISQKKLQKTWENTQEKIQKNRENGSKGGRPKTKENNDLDKADGSGSDNPNESIPEPEPEPELEDDQHQRAGARDPDPPRNPDPFHEPKPDDPPERVVALRFLALRREAWPHAGMHGPLSTSEAVAKSLLGIEGATLPALLEALDAQIRKRAETHGHDPPHTLKFFAKSLQSAMLTHAQAGRLPDAVHRPHQAPNPAAGAPRGSGAQNSLAAFASLLGDADTGGGPGD